MPVRGIPSVEDIKQGCYRTKVFADCEPGLLSFSFSTCCIDRGGMSGSRGYYQEVSAQGQRMACDTATLEGIGRHQGFGILRDPGME